MVFSTSSAERLAPLRASPNKRAALIAGAMAMFCSLLANCIVRQQRTYRTERAVQKRAEAIRDQLLRTEPPNEQSLWSSKRITMERALIKPSKPPHEPNARG